jgi:hypothetical protein
MFFSFSSAESIHGILLVSPFLLSTKVIGNYSHVRHELLQRSLFFVMNVEKIWINCSMSSVRKPEQIHIIIRL